MNSPTCRQISISRTLIHAPTHHKQALVAAGAVQAFLQGGNQRISSGFDVVLHGKDILALAALLGFAFADGLIGASERLHHRGHLQVSQILRQWK